MGSAMRTCLVIDDSRVIRKVIRRALEELSFQVSEAADGQQGLDACRVSMPDVVIVDWNMPVMTGLEYLRELRRTPGGDQPKVLMCTTENEPARIIEALAAGANEYIMKPFDTPILASKLDQLGLSEP